MGGSFICLKFRFIEKQQKILMEKKIELVKFWKYSIYGKKIDIIKTKVVTSKESIYIWHLFKKSGNGIKWTANVIILLIKAGYPVFFHTVIFDILKAFATVGFFQMMDFILPHRQSVASIQSFYVRWCRITFWPTAIIETGRPVINFTRGKNYN